MHLKTERQKEGERKRSNLLQKMIYSVIYFTMVLNITLIYTRYMTTAYKSFRHMLLTTPRIRAQRIIFYIHILQTWLVLVFKFNFICYLDLILCSFTSLFFHVIYSNPWLPRHNCVHLFSLFSCFLSHGLFFQPPEKCVCMFVSMVYIPVFRPLHLSCAYFRVPSIF